MSHNGAAISNRIANIRSAQVQVEVYKSEYQSKYRSWPWKPPRDPIKPTVIRGVSTLSYPAEMVSCTHRAFVPHKPKGPPRSYKPEHNEFSTPDVKMDTDTTYNVEFHEKVAKPRPSPFKPGEKVIDNKPFNAKTVYQAHFKEFTPEELDSCKVEAKPHDDNLGKEEKKAFDAQSTVQDSFRPLGKVPPATLIKPAENAHVDPTQPFQTETTHRAEFTHKTLPPKAPRYPPTPPPTRPNKPRQEKSQYLTVFKRDFVEHKASTPEQSFKPKQAYNRNPSKFDGRTTHRTSYQPIPYVAVKPRSPWANRDKTVVVSKAQRARLDLLTSYQEAFRDPARIIPMEKCRGVTYKVSNNLEGSGAGASGEKRAPMEDATSYNSSYQPWGKIKRAESFKLQQTYTIPKAPFFGKSTTGTHYKGVPAPPAKSCKPLIRPRSGPGKISSLTTYRATFGRRAVSCPPPRDADKSASDSQASRAQRKVTMPSAPPNTAATNTPAQSQTNQI